MGFQRTFKEVSERTVQRYFKAFQDVEGDFRGASGSTSQGLTGVSEAFQHVSRYFKVFQRVSRCFEGVLGCIIRSQVKFTAVSQGVSEAFRVVPSCFRAFQKVSERYWAASQILR